MADRLQMLLEAERRGILPAEQQGLLDEARRRGLVPAEGPPSAPAPAPATPSAPIDNPPTLGPSTATPGRKRTPLENLDRVAGMIAPQVRGVSAGLLHAFTSGASDEALGIADTLVKGGDMRENVATRRQQYESLPEGARQAGEIGGFVALPSAAIGAGPARQMALAAMEGGGFGYADAPGTVGERLEAAIPAAAASAATAGALRGAGALASPNVPDAVKRMIGMGVRVTPGQAMGRTATIGESGLTSLPIMGPGVARARERAIEDFNVGAINEALKPMGRFLPKTIPAGRRAVDQVYGIFNEAYEDALPAGSMVRYTREMVDDVAAVMRRAEDLLGKTEKTRLRGIVNRLYEPLSTKGPEIPTEKAQELRSFVRKQYRNALRNEPNLADVLSDLDDAYTALIERGVGPDRAAQLARVDEAYARFKPIQRASARLGAEEGVFTPAQLQAEVRRADRTADNSRFSRGEALMQDVSDAGVVVLGRRAPDSGTAPRLGNLAYPAGVAAGVYDSSMIMPMAMGAGSLALARAAYSNAGQELLRALAAGRQGPAAQAVRRALESSAQPAGRAVGAVTPALIEQWRAQR